MPKIWFGLFEKKMILKIVIFFILLASVFLMDFLNSNVKEKNEKMIKFIKNEKQYKKENKNLLNIARQYQQYLVEINPEADLDNIKSRNLNKILELLLRFGLKADSYDSQKIEKDGFVVFSYDITAFGSYGDIIRLFIHINTKVKFMFIKQYKMNKTGSKLVRIDLSIDVLGK